MVAKCLNGSLPTYEFDVDAIAPKDRVHMTEGAKLKCCGACPTRYTLRNWIRRGVLINGKRFRLPSTRNPERFTTADAYRWWRQKINELDALT